MHQKKPVVEINTIDPKKNMQILIVFSSNDPEIRDDPCSYTSQRLVELSKNLGASYEFHKLKNLIDILIPKNIYALNTLLLLCTFISLILG